MNKAEWGRKMTVLEYANGFDFDGNVVHLPENLVEYDKNVLIFVHTLKAGGSQYAVQCLIKELHCLGYGAYVVSPIDGIYRDIFVEKLGATVVIHNIYKLTDDYLSFLREAFDLVFLNSCVKGSAQIYLNMKVPAIWWMHETFGTIQDSFFDGPWRPDQLSDNFLVASPWKKVAEEFADKIKKKMQLLPIYVEDDYCKDIDNRETSKRKVFLIPGSYETRKGFHKVVEAIVQLNQKEMANVEFWFVGFIMEQGLYDGMKELSQYISNIKILGESSREEMNAYYEMADCVIVPTLMDSGPLTAVESLMHKKVCIISDATGVTAYMTDGKNALVYDVSAADGLLNKIRYYMENEKEMIAVAEKGRELYLSTFSEAAVIKSLEELMDMAFKCVE